MFKCKCGKKPSFGNKKATCCLACKTTEMVDIVHKRCKCGKRQPLR